MNENADMDFALWASLDFGMAPMSSDEPDLEL
jgi:hypothetical protein